MMERSWGYFEMDLTAHLQKIRELKPVDAIKLSVKLLNLNVNNPRAITQIGNFLRENQALLEEIVELLKQNLIIMCKNSQKYSDAEKLITLVERLGIDSTDLREMFDETYLKPGREILLPITNANPEFLHMICLKQLGDTILATGWSQEIQMQRKFQGTNLILYERNREIAEFYPHVQKVYPMSPDEMGKIEMYLRATKIPATANYIYGSPPWINGHPAMTGDLGLVEMNRRIFNLPPEAEYTFAKLDPPASLSMQDYSRAIILFPVANSVRIPAIDLKFWTSLIPKLKQLGFEIYTNLAPNENPIDGTIPLRVSLRELYFIAEQARFCIGVQSGIFDFLAQSKSRIISISLRRYFSWFNLDLSYHRKNLWDVYFNTPDYNPAADPYQAEFFSKVEDIELKILSIVKNFKE